MLTEAREIYYHGTSSGRARLVFKEGLRADIPPEQRQYDPERGTIASYGGIYATQNAMTAESEARKAAEKFGGAPVVFGLQVETRTALFDEDQLSASIPLTLFMRRVGQNIPSSDTAQAILIALDSLDWESYRKATGAAHWDKEWYDKVDGAMMPSFEDFIGFLNEKLERRMPGEFALRLFRPYKEMIRAWMRAAIEEKATDPWSGTAKTTPIVREAHEKLLRAVRGQIAKHTKGAMFGASNIRLDQDVGFRGANKILWAVQNDNAWHWRQMPRTGADMYQRYTVLYGKPDPEFWRQYIERVGPTFVVKPGSVRDLMPGDEERPTNPWPLNQSRTHELLPEELLRLRWKHLGTFLDDPQFQSYKDTPWPDEFGEPAYGQRGRERHVADSMRQIMRGILLTESPVVPHTVGDESTAIFYFELGHGNEAYHVDPGDEFEMDYTDPRTHEIWVLNHGQVERHQQIMEDLVDFDLEDDEAMEEYFQEHGELPTWSHNLVWDYLDPPVDSRWKGHFEGDTGRLSVVNPGQYKWTGKLQGVLEAEFNPKEIHLFE